MASFTFKFAETEGLFEKVLDLQRMVWPGEGVDVMSRRIRDNLPGMNNGNFLLLLEGEKPVATLNIIPQTWSIGGIPVKAAEMGMVATDPAYRNRGLQRILNQHYDKRVREERYDISVIEGIPYFYRQFGYEYTVPLNFDQKIPVHLLPDEKNSAEVKPLTKKDLPTAIRLFDENQRKFNVCNLRSKKVWLYQEKTGWNGENPDRSYGIWEDGHMVAYFRCYARGGEATVTEVSDMDAETSRTAAAWLKQWATEEKAKELVCRVSNIEAFSRYLTGLGATSGVPYGWQVKIINPVQLLTKLIPLFNSRLAASPFNRASLELPFNLFKYKILFKIEEGKVTSVTQIPGERRTDIQFPPNVFTKMVLGSHSRAEIQSHYPDAGVKTHYHMLIDALLPKLDSFIHFCY